MNIFNVIRAMTWKQKFALFTGAGVFLISCYNSKNGFVGVESTDVLLVIMGWTFALAASSSQFMVTSDFKKINWSILFLGLTAYTYSIWTNILGLQDWRGTVVHYDVVNILGGIFMDVYPEAAIAWALGESKLGDLFGNIVKAAQRKDELTDTGPRQPMRQQPQIDPQRLQPYGTASTQRPSVQPYTQPAQRPAPRPVSTQPNEPTFHPVSFPKDLEEFLNKES